MSNSEQNNSSSIAKVNYILLIVATIIGITAVVAVIIAYVNYEQKDDWLQTHYRFQIRTFWIGLLYTFIGAASSLFLIGYLILLFTFFWLIIRCAKGLKQLANNQPVNNLESWLFT